MNHQERKVSVFKNAAGKLFRGGFSNFLFRLSILSLVLALILPFLWIPASSAQSNAAFIRQIRVLAGDKTGLLSPAGLAFSSRANAFQVLEKQNSAADTNLVKLTPFADRAGSARISAAIKDPINVAFDNRVGRLLILHSSANQLLEVREDANGNLDPKTLTRYNVKDFGLQDPQGMTFDTAREVLYILDAVGPRLVRVEPGAHGSFEGAGVSIIDLAPSGLGAVRGLAYELGTGNLHIVVPDEQKLYEVTIGGEVVAERDLQEFGLKDPQGMVFAPSSDQTDDPSQFSLFLADSGQNDVQVTADSQGTGQILELSLSQPVAAAAATFTSTLVRTTDMSNMSPPSPDPSGITYLPNSNRLMVTDGEVEETVNNITHFQGANVWELTLGGGVIRTANISKKAPTVVPMTDEPTGVTWNPVDGHYFFTEDGGKRVYNLNPGGDGLVGTSDDSWTFFSTNTAGNGDPEGIAFDTLRNRLFVADGVNREVYEYTLTGTPVGHFDVGAFGVEDPETVEFNSDSGTLFVMSSNRPSPLIVETTISGGLLQTINISAANPKQAAGLAYAPASNGSGAKRFYIVDRGIDNNNDPKIIDGKMYEMTTSSSGPGTTPTATFTPTRTPTPGPSPTPTNTPQVTDLIFADGFESGNLSAWTSSSIDLGDLSVSTSAALVGTRGLQAVIDDINSIYVTDDSPNAEPRYRARFYFDPNSIAMLNGDTHFIFRGYSGTTTIALRVQFRFSSGAYQLRAGLVGDGSTWANSNWLTISDARHVIELDWRAATAAGANNGSLTVWIDGTQQANLVGVDNDTRRIDRARLGAVSGVDTGTQGTYYFDAFESRRQTFIGP
jgi:sugar lactone lactonase YvrE